MTSHCNRCGTTEHVIVHQEDTSFSEERYDVSWGTSYQMIKCAGCGDFSIRTESWNSEFRDDDGRYETDIKFYPPRLFRKLPAWYETLQTHLPAEKAISELLAEIYTALQNDLRRLAAMGIRSLLEHIMIDKVGDQGRFIQNLDAFATAGYISRVQRDIIEPALEAGHASIHRNFKPSIETIASLIGITEGLVDVLYIQPHQAAAIRSTVPPRRRSKAQQGVAANP